MAELWRGRRKNESSLTLRVPGLEIGPFYDEETNVHCDGRYTSCGCSRNPDGFQMDWISECEDRGGSRGYSRLERTARFPSRRRIVFVLLEFRREGFHRMKPSQNLAFRAAYTALSAMTVLLCVSTRADAASANCESLAQLKVDHGEVTAAQALPAGLYTVHGLMGVSKVKLPAFCSVKLTLRPTPDSDIKVEVWMPASGWNSRLEAVGNGGLAGSISEDAMAGALSAGYAAAGTDTGHTGSPVTGNWALGRPEKIIDFGWRAVHLMTVEAKALIAAYYGAPVKHAYWNGCSEGGGQALSEAQRFPDDYDGILAGAPANYFDHLQMGGNWISQAIHEDPATMIAPSKLPAITAAVMAECDMLDGVKDGVLEDPRQCHFDPEKLLCKDDEDDSCLTEPQIAGLKKVYDGAKNPRTGVQIFPGIMRGSEAGWGMWIAGTQVPPTNAQHVIMVNGLSNLVFDGPKWNWKTFDFDKDVAYADNKVGSTIDHINPDLSRFKKHSGKLLQYHGWNDPAISPLNSIQYFESVQAKMGDTASFYRLFMIPGMEHCMGGPGASGFDHMKLIVKWVEDGVAPDRIVASKPGGTHLLCAYPKFAKYTGKGSTDDAANYMCAAERAETDAAPTWTDPTTGLMWTGKDNSGDVSWNQAAEYCSNLQLAGLSGWRLPTIEELQGIDDPSVTAQAMFDAGVTGVHVKGSLKLTGWLWSISQGGAAGKPSNGPWNFNFAGEQAGDSFPVGFSYSMRALCVRNSEE
jgi:hypothetical protein